MAEPDFRLSALERRVRDSIARRGLGRFVLVVAVASVALSEVITFVLLTAVDTPPKEKWIGLGIAFLVPSVVAPFMGWFVGRLLHNLGQASVALRHLAETDPLTGVCNRRAFADRSAALWDRRGDAIAVVVMVDVDHFKVVNDRFGHAAGDRVLVSLADGLADAAARADDAVVGRLGGDEFAIVALVGDAPAATTLVSAVREACALRAVAPGASATVGVVTTLDLVHPSTTLDAAVALADHALYASKGSGVRTRWRAERVELSPDPSTAAR